METLDGEEEMIKRTREEVLRLWVKALRSGEYRQGQGFLRETIQGKSHFCCLGVLADLAKKDGGPKWKACTDVIAEINGDESFLPKSWEDWLKIKQKRLAKMNDQGKSFAQIADYIERNYK